MYKPPIGVSPASYLLPNRIKDLANAISRYSEHERIYVDKEVNKIIREWATEIIGVCDTIDKLIDFRFKAGGTDE